MRVDLIRKIVSGGKIFTVTFTKKNGEKRVMNARTGVSKGVTGKGMSYNPVSKNLLAVYDMQKRDYRMINCNTIEEIKVLGETIYT